MVSTGCRNTGQPSASAFAYTSQKRLSSSSTPFTFVARYMPRMPGSFDARSSSLSASSGACIGSIARPTKRVGCRAWAAEAASLNDCASASPRAGEAQ